MDINSSLKLVFPVRLGDNGEGVVWAYHIPISAEIFRMNYRIIALAKAELFKGPDLKARLQNAAENGPVIGKSVLLDAAAKDAADHDSPDQGQALLAEIGRLTTIIAPSPTGFEPVPLEIAFAHKTISESERDEVESSIVFFTCGYAMSRTGGKAWMADVMARSMMGSITSLALSAFAESLKISTATATTETPAALSAAS